jgi:hypothetical protein
VYGDYSGILGEINIMTGSSLRADPRLVYLILLLVITVPILTRTTTVVPISPTTRALYNFIQNLPPNSLVVESFDYATSVVPELHPQAIVVTQQLFNRPLKILFVALDNNGPTLADAVLDAIDKGNRSYGVDYANLGYIPNTATLIGMPSNIAQFLPLDTHGNPTASLPIIKEFPAAKQAALVITFDDDSSALYSYLQYWQGRSNIPVAVGATATLAPGFMPFYNSGQLVGVLISIRAAAEYELLLNQQYKCCLGISGASSAMVALSMSHLLIIAMVVFGNAAYFFGKRSLKKAQ